jgi:hypothetical protein
MLLGAEMFFEIFSGQKRTRLGHPVLLETTLGWILSGKIPESSYGHHATAATCLTRVDSIDVQLQNRSFGRWKNSHAAHCRRR